MSEAILILCLMTIFPLILTVGIFAIGLWVVKCLEDDSDKNQNSDIY
jgi:hypothetical protein